MNFSPVGMCKKPETVVLCENTVVVKVVFVDSKQQIRDPR